MLHDPFWHTVFGRRSIRRYRPEPVPRATLERLLTAAHWAPSAHNRQPWRFVVITDVDKKRVLAQAMSHRWERDMMKDGLPKTVIQARLRRSRERLLEPPVLVLGCLSMEDMDDYPDSFRQRNEWIMGVQSVSLALGNLMLAAAHEGLGTCWMCAPLFAADEVHRALGLPKRWEPLALLSLGYPAEEGASSRKPLEEVILWM